MYGKLFVQMYDGTLATKGPWQALVTFQQLIILADRHGHVDMTPEAISRRTTLPLEVITKGIEALEKNDPDSRTPDEDGRRILRLSDTRAWGWRIVNHARYRSIRSQEDRRAYMRQYQRQRRAAAKGVNQIVNNVSNINQSSKQEAVSKRGHKRRAPSTSCPSNITVSDQMHSWAEAQGLPTDRVLPETAKFLSYHRSKGSTFVDWQAAWQNWMRKAVEFGLRTA